MIPTKNTREDYDNINDSDEDKDWSKVQDDLFES